MIHSILLVEDESRIREVVTDYFELEQWRVHQAENGKQALEMFELCKVDLVILDIMMPEMDGWSVCKRIRQRSAVPIIILTARSDDDDKLLGFELGADDYVTKPFSPKVLVARAKMLMKRVEGTVGQEDNIISYGKLTVNKRARSVKIADKEIELAPREYELLVCLIINYGTVLSRETILNAVWGYDYFGDLRTVDTHIKKLRAKLEDEGRYIRTVIRAGYKFEVAQ